MKKSDRQFMIQAIAEADKCVPEDNRIHPKVGVVVVASNGIVLAKGFRGEISTDSFPSGDHAEFTALEKKLRTESLAGATVYSTLEPCTTRNHPKVPCAARLIERHVTRVVIGMLDPNQGICGRGIRLLREARVATDLFPSDLMARVEEQNRDFIREQEKESRDLQSISEMLKESDLTRFIPSRAHYAKYRNHMASICEYINSAKKSVHIVSITLSTGLTYEELEKLLREKLRTSAGFKATISLLNPTKTALMEAIAPVLQIDPRALAKQIKDNLDTLRSLRTSLPTSRQARLTLSTHNCVPFGSAILLDEGHPHARLQIETKPYEAGLNGSFAMEFGQRGGDLFKRLSRAYLALLNAATRV